MAIYQGAPSRDGDEEQSHCYCGGDSGVAVSAEVREKAGLSGIGGSERQVEQWIELTGL